MSNSNSLKYPIAKQKGTNLLVNAIDVENGLNCQCLCPFCNDDFVAINKEKKQRAHFRHKSNSNCSASYESYIHWLTKEVFKDVTEINLPPISLKEFINFSDNKLLKLSSKFDMPFQFRSQLYNELLGNINSRLKEIKIDSVEIEKEYSTEKGKIRVDVVLKIGNKDLFIEPYFVNPIDSVKRDKLKELNISTISIRLIDFIAKNNHIYTKEELKKFLTKNISCKTWEYIKQNSLITNKDYAQIEQKLTSNSEVFKQREKLLSKEKEIDSEIAELSNEIQKTQRLIYSKKRLKEQINEHIKKLRLE